MRWPSFPWLIWAFSSSLALHGVAYASLSLAPARAATLSIASEVTLELSPAPRSEPDRTPEPAEAPEPQIVKTLPLPSTQRAAPASVEKMASHPQAPPEAHPASAPLDLSGVTLTNDSNSGFSMALGNGQAFAGPIGNGQRAAAAPAPQARPSSAPNPMLPELVAAADLSSRPVPPALEGSLRANYPAEAKLRGIGGSARVRARIDPDGSVRRTQVESESFAGFGDACRRTLQASRWSAPRDHSGRPVATEIRYTCHFVVEP